jgi:hypothetical protein
MFLIDLRTLEGDEEAGDAGGKRQLGRGVPGAGGPGRRGQAGRLAGRPSRTAVATPPPGPTVILPSLQIELQAGSAESVIPEPLGALVRTKLYRLDAVGGKWEAVRQVTSGSPAILPPDSTRPSQYIVRVELDEGIRGDLDVVAFDLHASLTPPDALDLSLDGEDEVDMAADRTFTHRAGFQAHGGVGQGTSSLYYVAYVERSLGGRPFRVGVTMDELGVEAKEQCATEESGRRRRECLDEYLRGLTSRFYGTGLPVCEAASLVEAGLIADCRLAARHVGQEAFATLHSTLYDSYSMCGDVDVCRGGCHAGVLARWVEHAAGDRSHFRREAGKVCRLLTDGSTERCVEGIGAGLVSAGGGAEDTALRVCLDIAAHLEDDDEATTFGAQCITGALREWMDGQTVEMTDDEYAEAFPTFCAHGRLAAADSVLVGPDAAGEGDSGPVLLNPELEEQIGTQFRDLCYASLGENAGFRALLGDSVTGPTEALTAAILSCATLVPNFSDEAKEACLRGARRYVNPSTELTAATCTDAHLFSTLSLGHSTAEHDRVEPIRIPWSRISVNDGPLWLTPPSAAVGLKGGSLWWLRLDPRGAQVPFEVTFEWNDEQIDPETGGDSANIHLVGVDGVGGGGAALQPRSHRLVSAVAVFAMVAGAVLYARRRQHSQMLLERTMRPHI